MKTKRILSVILSVCMLFSMLTMVSASADGEVTETITIKYNATSTNNFTTWYGGADSVTDTITTINTQSGNEELLAGVQTLRMHLNMSDKDGATTSLNSTTILSKLASGESGYEYPQIDYTVNIESDGFYELTVLGNSLINVEVSKYDIGVDGDFSSEPTLLEKKKNAGGAETLLHLNTWGTYYLTSGSHVLSFRITDVRTTNSRVGFYAFIAEMNLTSTDYSVSLKPTTATSADNNFKVWNSLEDTNINLDSSAEIGDLDGNTTTTETSVRFHRRFSDSSGGSGHSTYSSSDARANVTAFPQVNYKVTVDYPGFYELTVIGNKVGQDATSDYELGVDGYFRAPQSQIGSDINSNVSAEYSFGKYYLEKGEHTLTYRITELPPRIFGLLYSMTLTYTGAEDADLALKTDYNSAVKDNVAEVIANTKPIAVGTNPATTLMYNGSAKLANQNGWKNVWNNTEYYADDNLLDAKLFALNGHTTQYDAKHLILSQQTYVPENGWYNLKIDATPGHADHLSKYEVGIDGVYDSLLNSSGKYTNTQYNDAKRVLYTSTQKNAVYLEKGLHEISFDIDTYTTGGGNDAVRFALRCTELVPVTKPAGIHVMASAYESADSAITALPAAAADVNAEINIYNNTASDADLVLIIAQYNGDKLVKAVPTDITVKAGKTIVADSEVLSSVAKATGTKVRAFVWSDMDNTLTPLTTINAIE